MSDQPETLRSIDLARTAPGTYTARNRRGGEMLVGTGEGSDFTPVELLLVALAGCSAIDLDLITAKRAPADVLQIRATGHKVRDEKGNHLVDLALTLDLRFPDGEAGDAARNFLPRAVEMTRDRLCTVTRTVALGEPVAFVEAGED